MRNDICLHLMGLVLAATWSGSGAADSSKVMEAWRTPGAWLTELRQHQSGLRVCTTGKAFGHGSSSGLSIVQGENVTLLTLVDQQQPPMRGGELNFAANGKQLGSISVTVEDPAFATSEADSTRAWQIISNLPPTPILIAVGDRRYAADLSGIDIALAKLKACRFDAKSNRR
jgi:hypothetical protein